MTEPAFLVHHPAKLSRTEPKPSPTKPKTAKNRATPPRATTEAIGRNSRPRARGGVDGWVGVWVGGCMGGGGWVGGSHPGVEDDGDAEQPGIPGEPSGAHLALD